MKVYKIELEIQFQGFAACHIEQVTVAAVSIDNAVEQALFIACSRSGHPFVKLVKTVIYHV